ncbi:MAG: hypothetical protein K2L96_07010 [Muribaculaceae bacterium]|nr:hypothetical protein [Muribaculaceae bacterium]
MKAILTKGDGSVRVATDSTILRTGDPLFVADHLGEWTLEVCPAVRISRLGTNIPLKVAGRYFDSLLLVGVVDAKDSDMLPAGVISLLDRSIAPGDETSAQELDHDEQVLHIESAEGRTEQRFAGLRERFEKAVHELSRYCTFKTGDLLILRNPESGSIPLRPDTEIRAELTPGPTLRLRIK